MADAGAPPADEKMEDAPPGDEGAAPAAGDAAEPAPEATGDGAAPMDTDVKEAETEVVKKKRVKKLPVSVSGRTAGLDQKALQVLARSRGPSLPYHSVSGFLLWPLPPSPSLSSLYRCYKQGSCIATKVPVIDPLSLIPLYLSMPPLPIFFSFLHSMSHGRPTRQPPSLLLLSFGPTPLYSLSPALPPLPGTFNEYWYKHPWACCAVFRELIGTFPSCVCCSPLSDVEGTLSHEPSRQPCTECR
jgi:hypothetical protein